MVFATLKDDVRREARATSATGHSRHFQSVRGTSGYPPTAALEQTFSEGRLGPLAEISSALDQLVGPREQRRRRSRAGLTINSILVTWITGGSEGFALSPNRDRANAACDPAKSSQMQLPQR